MSQVPEPTPGSAAAFEVTHECPLIGQGLTPCCGRTPFELSPTDRLTTLRELVTCPRAED